MESKKLVALLCQRCGSPLPENLKCEYCKTSHIVVEYVPEGQNHVAMTLDGAGIYDAYEQDDFDNPYGPVWDCYRVAGSSWTNWEYSENDLRVVLQSLGDFGYFEYFYMVEKAVERGYAKWTDESFAGQCGNASLTQRGKQKLRKLDAKSAIPPNSVPREPS